MSLAGGALAGLQPTQTQTCLGVTWLAEPVGCQEGDARARPAEPAGSWAQHGRPEQTAELELPGAGMRTPAAEMDREAGGRRPGRARQEGHIWGSMRRTAFILGSGLLLSVAFWNSLTWHLQRFWGASGHFWQTQWEALLSTFEGKEWVLYLIGATQVPGLLFWAFNGLLLVADTTGKPHFITRYRIQPGKNDPVDRARLRQAVRTVLFNQYFISLPILLLLYPVLRHRADPCRRQLPTFQWFLLELAIFTLLEEALFYYSHRLLHHPALYKKIHKKHHEWTAPIGVVALYAHPIEHVASNMLPAVVGPLVLGSHLSSITVWFSLALVVTTISHCGYHLPLLPSPEFHDYHHLKFNQCYGVLGALDHLHGTDTLFKQSKAYERHVVLLGLTPLSQSIPDPPKKAH